MKDDIKTILARASRQRMEGDLDGAICSFQAAITLAETAPPFERAELNNRLAALLLKTNRLDLAWNAASISLKLELDHGDRGLETTRLADYCIMMARICEKQRRFADAAKYIERSLEVFDDLLGCDNNYVKDVREFWEEMKDNAWRQGSDAEDDGEHEPPGAAL